MSAAPQYLLVVYIAEQQHGPGPIAPTVIAEALDRSPAATTEMLQRLEDRGLVTHAPYDGATLTSDGREAGEELYETYTTLSQFFREILDLDDHDEEAMRLAGNISPLVVERLASTLLHDTESESGDDGTAPSFFHSE